MENKLFNKYYNCFIVKITNYCVYYYFLVDEANISNSTTKNKSINAKPCDINSANFNKNEISKLFF